MNLWRHVQKPSKICAQREILNWKFFLFWIDRLSRRVWERLLEVRWWCDVDEVVIWPCGLLFGRLGFTSRFVGAASRKNARGRRCGSPKFDFFLPRLEDHLYQHVPATNINTLFQSSRCASSILFTIYINGWTSNKKVYILLALLEPHFLLIISQPLSPLSFFLSFCV